MTTSPPNVAASTHAVSEQKLLFTQLAAKSDMGSQGPPVNGDDPDLT
jgi:hypothetical protein